MEFCIPDELLRLPRIGFILNTSTGPPDNPVEHKALVVVLLARAKSGSNGELILRSKLSLKPLKLGPRPRAGEIITMNAHHDASLGVYKDTCG